MEKTTTKEMLEEQIRELVEKLKITDEGSETFSKIVKDIQVLVNSYAELERTENDKTDKDRRFEEEIRFKDQELHYKDSLERDKMQDQKKAGNRDAIIKIGSVLLMVGSTAALSLLGLKLEFIDHGSVCSFGVKELLKKAGQTVKMI